MHRRSVEPLLGLGEVQQVFFHSMDNYRLTYQLNDTKHTHLITNLLWAATFILQAVLHLESIYQGLPLALGNGLKLMQIPNLDCRVQSGRNY